jgi:hypothetical protein
VFHCASVRDAAKAASDAGLNTIATRLQSTYGKGRATIRAGSAGTSVLGSGSRGRDAKLLNSHEFSYTKRAS